MFFLSYLYQLDCFPKHLENWLVSGFFIVLIILSYSTNSWMDQEFLYLLRLPKSVVFRALCVEPFLDKVQAGCMQQYPSERTHYQMDAWLSMKGCTWSIIMDKYPAASTGDSTVTRLHCWHWAPMWFIPDSGDSVCMHKVAEITILLASLAMTKIWFLCPLLSGFSLISAIIKEPSWSKLNS